MKFNLFPPALIIVTDDIPNGFAGYTMAFLVKIKQRYIDSGDIGLLNHELRHVLQFWTCTLLGLIGAYITYYLGQPIEVWGLIGIASAGIHGALYTLVPAYRQAAEVDAYVVQLKTYGTTECPDWLSVSLATKYNLNLTPQFVKDLINSKLK